MEKLKQRSRQTAQTGQGEMGLLFKKLFIPFDFITYIYYSLSSESDLGFVNFFVCLYSLLI